MTTIFSVLTPESSTKGSTPEPDLAIVKEEMESTAVDAAAVAAIAAAAKSTASSTDSSISSSMAAAPNSRHSLGNLDSLSAGGLPPNLLPHSASLPVSNNNNSSENQNLPVPQSSPRRASNASSASTTPQLQPLSIGVSGIGGGVVPPPLSPRRSSTASSISTQPFRLGEMPFAEEDEEIASSYLVWGGIAMYYAEMYVGLKKMRDLNTFLLEVVESIFAEIATDTVVSRILTKAKQLVEADR